MRNLAAALCLLCFSAQAASAGWIASTGAAGATRDMIVRVDWQYPWQLPLRFRNHCAYEYFTARPFLFRSLRRRLSILLLLASLVRLLSSRARLLRLERLIALSSIGYAT